MQNDRNDLISRQAAIDTIYKAFSYAYCDNCEKGMDEDLCGDCHRKYQNWSASRKTIENTLNALPSIQPQQKTGYWKLLKNGDAKCSVCGFTQIAAWDYDSQDNYCHHCGSYNGGRHEDR